MVHGPANQHISCTFPFAHAHHTSRVFPSTHQSPQHVSFFLCAIVRLACSRGTSLVTSVTRVTLVTRVTRVTQVTPRRLAHPGHLGHPGRVTRVTQVTRVTRVTKVILNLSLETCAFRWRLQCTAVTIECHSRVAQSPKICFADVHMRSACKVVAIGTVIVAVGVFAIPTGILGSGLKDIYDKKREEAANEEEEGVAALGHYNRPRA